MTFPLWWAIVLALATFAMALVLTPLVRSWALRVGFLDHPGARKVHRVPMPTGGGFAVAGAFLTGLWASSLLPGGPPSEVLLGLTVVGIVALTLGWLDDRFGVPGVLKLLVQAGCGFLLHSLGFGIDKLTNPLGGPPILLVGLGVPLDLPQWLGDPTQRGRLRLPRTEDRRDIEIERLLPPGRELRSNTPAHRGRYRRNGHHGHQVH